MSTVAFDATAQSGRRSLAPRDVALGILAVYLMATAAVMAMTNTASWPVIGLHIAGAAFAAWCVLARESSTIGDLMPLLAPPVLYAEIPRLISAFGSGTYHDRFVQAMELSLFHAQPAHTLAGQLPWMPLSELLHAGYLAYFVALVLPPLMLLARGEKQAYGETVLALCVTGLVSWVLFAVAPVEGPRFEWSAPPGIPDGPVRRLTLYIVEGGSSRGAAFPSSHMALSVVQAVMALRWQTRRVAIALWVIAALVGVGAVYAGFHYAVDMLAGAVLGGIIASVTMAFTRGRRAIAAPQQPSRQPLA